jgi:membrane-associated phospholipid phosphatase
MAELERHKPSTRVSAQRAMTWQRRLLWLLVLFGVQLLYVPINRTMHGGTVLATPWDAAIPLWPIWAVPYLLSIAWWVGCFVWAAWKMEDVLYRAFVASFLIVMLTSYAVYILYPTYVERPVLEGSSWQVELLSLIYRNDRLHNAFPSGHAYTTLLITFFWWRWQPRLRWLWIAFAIVVILSTLFTGQHNLPDPVGGLVFAWLGYRFGLWWAARQPAGE